LGARKPYRFDLQPDAATCARIAVALGTLAVRDLRLKGELRPAGRRDLTLVAELTATVVQPCGITLAPVTTRLTEPVLRRYIVDYVVPEGDEVEMPEDDTTEPLTAEIDAGAVAVEALALALPLYPRAPGATLGTAAFAEPGTPVLTDDDVKPLAGLGALKDRLFGAGTDGTRKSASGAGTVGTGRADDGKRGPDDGEGNGE